MAYGFRSSENLRGNQCWSGFPGFLALVMRLRYRAPHHPLLADNLYTAGMGCQQESSSIAGTAYGCIGIPSLHLREGIETLGQFAAMTSELIGRPTHTLSTFGQFGILLVEQQPLSVFDQLFSRKL